MYAVDRPILIFLSNKELFSNSPLNCLIFNPDISSFEAVLHQKKSSFQILFLRTQGEYRLFCEEQKIIV